MLLLTQVILFLEKKKKMYAMLDGQSNVSLARTSFSEAFNVQCEPLPYTMKMCSGTTNISGRIANGFVIEGIDGKVPIPLLTLIEYNQIPDNRMEIPTPEATAHHPHLQSIASQIPPLLLLGSHLSPQGP